MCPAYLDSIYIYVQVHIDHVTNVGSKYTAFKASRYLRTSRDEVTKEIGRVMKLDTLLNYLEDYDFVTLAKEDGTLIDAFSISEIHERYLDYLVKTVKPDAITFHDGINEKVEVGFAITLYDLKF